MTIDALLFADADIATQLALLLIWAVVWHQGMHYIAKRMVEPFVQSRPWRDQWTELSRKYFKQAFFVEFKTTEETFEAACLFAAIMFQHGVGGALCLPSLLGWRGPAATAMACHGALCEAGWELQDVVDRARLVLFGGEKGRAKNPTPILVVLAIHHSLGLSMVLPMNMMYGGNEYYHELVFVMQGAAFFAMLTQLYGFTLDVATADGLLRMKACAGSTCLMLLWSRVFRFGYIGHRLIILLSADGHTALVVVACFGLSMMAVFNFLFTVDAIKKFVKFIGMHAMPGAGGPPVRPKAASQRFQTRMFIPTLQRKAL